MSFVDNLYWRFAIKKFGEKKLTDAHRQKLVNAMRYAPSAWNLQPFHISVITSDTIKAKLSAVGRNVSQIDSCDTLFIFSASNDMEKRINLKKVSKLNQGDSLEAMDGYITAMQNDLLHLTKDEARAWAARSMYITLGFGLAAAAELGIDACPMEGMDNEEYKKILGLEDDLYPLVMCAFGFREDGTETPQKQRLEENELFTFV